MGSSMCTISDDSLRPIPYAQRNHYDDVKYKGVYSSKTVTKHKPKHHGKRTSQRSHHSTTKRRDESSAGAPDNSLIPVDDSVGYLS